MTVPLMLPASPGDGCELEAGGTGAGCDCARAEKLLDARMSGIHNKRAQRRALTRRAAFPPALLGRGPILRPFKRNSSELPYNPAPVKSLTKKLFFDQVTLLLAWMREVAVRLPARTAGICNRENNFSGAIGWVRRRA